MLNIHEAESDAEGDEDEGAEGEGEEEERAGEDHLAEGEDDRSLAARLQGDGSLGQRLHKLRLRSKI